MKRILLFLLSVMLTISLTLQAQNTCTAPTNLTAGLHYPDWHNVNLNWNSVVDSSEATIKWSTTTLSTRIGLNAAGDFSGVVRFEPSDLTAYAGRYLTAVSFIPGEAQTVCTYSIRVWQGGSFINNVFDPGTLLIDQVITSALTVESLNTIMLDTALLIDVTQELWIGIRCNTTAGYPLGASNNGVVSNKGELLNMDTLWETLTASSLTDYNWVIIGTLTDPSVDRISGYNVYRDNTLLSSVTTTFYLDSVPAGTYTYDVTANYISGCESSPISLSVTMNEDPCANCLDTVDVGSGTSTTYLLPMNTFYNYSYSQQIYTAVEVGNIVGRIPCIGFQYIYGTPQTKNFKIYMGNTNKSSFSSGTDWVPLNDMFLVYDGDYTFTNTGVDNWVNIPLNTPFEWDGTSNIVVAVLNNTGSYVSSSNPTFNVHDASSLSVYVQNDGSPYSPGSSNPSGTVGSVRNNIRFFEGTPIECPLPSHYAVSQVTHESAFLSWNSRGSESGYEVVVVPEGSSLGNETAITVSDTTYNVTNLQPNTEYTVYMRAICTLENSSWQQVTFTTLCVPTDVLPYVVTCDSIGTGTAVIPDCWTRGIGGSSETYPYVSSTYHHSGNASLYFYSYTTNFVMACGQGLDLTQNSDVLTMSFYAMKTSSSYGRLEAGYMTDPADQSTFVSLKSLYPTDYPATTTWYEFTMVLPDAVNGTVIYPAFYCPGSSSSNYVYVDDIVVKTGCPNPTNLTVSEVSHNFARLSWLPAAGSALDYIIEYGPENSSVMNTMTVSNTGTCLLTGLDTNTVYEVYLMADCASEADTLQITFQTLLPNDSYCVLEDTTRPAIVGTSSSTNYTIPVNNFYNYTYSQQIFTPTEVGAAGLLSGIEFQYSYSSASTQKTNCAIYLAHRTSSTFASTTDWTPIASAVKVYEGPMNCRNGWNRFDFTTDFYYNGTDNLVVIVDDNSGHYNGSSYVFATHAATDMAMAYYNDSNNPDPTAPPTGTKYAYRNNVKFIGCAQSEQITCIAPTVFVDEAGNDYVTISWVPGDSESEWVLEYMAENDSVWTYENNIVTNPPYTIENLNPSTEYSFRLRGVCAPTDSSLWTIVTAATVCDYVNIPYSQDFESAAGSGSAYFIDCWYRQTSSSTNYPYASSSYHQSGQYSLYFYGTSSIYSYATLPRFANDVVMDSLMVRFSILGTSSNYFIEFGVMQNPTDYSTFVPMGTASVGSTTYNWLEFELNTTGYTGNGHYLAFRIPAWCSSYIYLDDIYVGYQSSCAHLTALAAQDITSNGATLTWTAGGEETEWEYVYGPAGSVDPNNDMPESAYTNSAMLTGLTANTSYEAYVRSVCSSAETSDWMHIVFLTDCDALTALPLVETFDSVCTHTSNITSGPNNLMNCWNAINTGSSYNAYPYIYYSSSYAVSGNYSLRFYTYASTAYSDQYVVLPAIETTVNPLNSLQLSFDMNPGTTSYPFCLVVGVMTGVDAQTFEPTDTITLPMGASMEHQTFYFENYNGNGDRFAIMAPRTIPNSSYNYGTIDNIVLDLAPACRIPLHLTVDSVSSTSVGISWTGPEGASSWNVEFGPHGFTPGTGISAVVSTNSIVIDTLTSGVKYDFYVQTDCGSGSESEWVGPISAVPGAYSMPVTGNVSITTCSMVVYDAGGETGNYPNSCNATLTIYPEPGNSISIEGTVNIESSYDYLYIYDGPDVNGTVLGYYSGQNLTVPQLISSTGPVTLYFYSDPSVSYSGFELFVSCVSNACPAPTGLTVSNVDNSSATVSWTPSGTESSWDVDYKTANSSTWNTTVATTNSYTLTGLSPLTTYDVRVRARCTEEDSRYVETSFTTTNCIASQQCEYTFVMTDDFGDGWNGGYMTVTQGAFSQQLMAVDYDYSSVSTTDTVRMMLCTGDPVTVTWTSGMYDDEVSISIIGPDGTVLFSQVDMDSYTGGPTLVTFTPNCGGGGVEDCETPTNVHTESIDHNSAVISWTQPGSNAVSWKLDYKKAAAATWTSVDNISTPSYTLSNLEPATEYVVRVAANCSGNNSSEFSSDYSFTTTTGLNDYVMNTTIWPNPTTGQFRIENSELRIETVEVYDVYGKLIKTVKVEDHQVVMDLSGNAAGVYFARIYTDKGMVTKQIVKK